MAQEVADIVRLCVEIDQAAGKVYRGFVGDETDPALKAVWEQLAGEEDLHVEYWRKILRMAEDGHVPQLFDDPPRTEAQLRRVLGNVASLAAQPGQAEERERRFLVALQLEFYLLHPAFEALMFCLRAFAEKPPEEEYADHVHAVLDALKEHGGASPELALIGTAIGQLWERTRQLEYSAQVDPVSGLLNRRGFRRSALTLAHLAQRRGETVGMLILDIDHFKLVNDTRGHDVGDAVLRSVGETLGTVLRKSDVAGRIGGDEFTVLLVTSGLAGLAEVAERIRAAVEASSCEDQRVTISIGAALGRVGAQPNATLDELFKRSDACLFEAKRAGRNAVRVCPDEVADASAVATIPQEPPGTNPG